MADETERKDAFPHVPVAFPPLDYHSFFADTCCAMLRKRLFARISAASITAPRFAVTRLALTRGPSVDFADYYQRHKTA